MRRACVRTIERFVGTDIKGANDDGLALEPFGDGTIGLELLILCGRVFPVHEQKFAAKQANAGRARLTHSIEIARQLNIGVQFDVRAFECFGQRALDTREFLPLEFPQVLLEPVFGQHRFIRLDDDHALRAIDDDELIFAQQFAGRVQRDDRRNRQAARQNRGVRSRTTQVGHKRGHLMILELNHIGGR